MKIIKTIKQAREFTKINKGKTIGLVPTMGALHEGHLSLVKKARAQCDIMIVSIFVNPTQFGPNEDFQNYPKQEKQDFEKLIQEKTDAVFYPDVLELYPDGYDTYVQVEKLTKNLCGTSRPTHFMGVTTIVNKLFNIIQPNKAYFGEKDFQQLIVIKKMAKDLNMPIEIIGCPIVREKDGLAKSSRNSYLTPEQKKDAVVLLQSLNMAEQKISAGQTDSKQIISMIKQKINEKQTAKIDYIKIVDPDTLEDLPKIKLPLLIALAVYFGKARLIDNKLIKIPK